MKLNRQSGVTLIEILIAVSLLSLLSVGVLVAMRIALNTLDKTDAHLIHNRRIANSEKILENQLAGLMVTQAEWRPGPDISEILPFVQFEAQTMRFVTSYSLQDGLRGHPQIAAFQVIPGERGVGVRLIVNETPYTGRTQAGLMVTGVEPEPQTGTRLIRYAAVVPSPQSFILADRLAYCRFVYLERRFEPPFTLWRSDWVRPFELPLGIRIEMAPLTTVPGELHVGTVTVPLHLTRDTTTLYNDGN